MFLAWQIPWFNIRFELAWKDHSQEARGPEVIGETVSAHNLFGISFFKFKIEFDGILVVGAGFNTRRLFFATGTSTTS